MFFPIDLIHVSGWLVGAVVPSFDLSSIKSMRRMDNRTMSNEPAMMGARSSRIYLILDVRLTSRNNWEVLQVVGEIAV
jgi:hypothetical protein